MLRVEEESYLYFNSQLKCLADTHEAKKFITQVMNTDQDWSVIEEKKFLSVIELLIKSEYVALQSWFLKYFTKIAITEISSTSLQKGFDLFNQFLQLVITHRLLDVLSTPPKENISLQLAKEDYLLKCNTALELAVEKNLQATLLDNLPNLSTIKKAFSKKLPVISNVMLYRHQLESKITIGSLQTIFDYPEYKAKALIYMAEQIVRGESKEEKRTISKDVRCFKQLMQYFKSLDQMPLTLLSPDEKIIMSHRFIYSIHAAYESDVIQAFIKAACDLKEKTGTSSFKLLFESVITHPSDHDLNHYITLSKFLIKASFRDISRVRGTIPVEYLREHLPKLSETARLYADEEILLPSRKRFPEEKLETILSKWSMPEVDKIILKKIYLDVEVVAEKYRLLPPSELAKEAKKHGKILQLDSSQLSSQQTLVAIIRETVKHVFDITPYSTQILSLLALIQFPAERKGRIAQIRTGEGKSLIIAMLAAYFASQNKCVDITTSNQYLAKRDQKKYAAFFTALGISSSDICHPYPDKKNFDGLVIYATNYDIEFSLLRDDLYSAERRYTTVEEKSIARPRDVIIIDEVDNAMINEANNMARIATPLAMSKAWVYQYIYNYVKAVGKPFESTPKALSFIRAYLSKVSPEKYAEQTEDLTDKQLKKWLASAIKAIFDLKEDRDYVVKPVRKMTSMGERVLPQIIIVDYKNTGRLSSNNCRWKEGLHEFLEIKHDIPHGEESMTIGAISHASLLKGYKNIFGLTGTIGGEHICEEIKKIYQVDAIYVPPHYPSVREEYSPCFLIQKITYEQRILDDIQMAIAENRPVLVLFTTIKQAKEFCSFLKEKSLIAQLINEMQQEDEEYLVTRAGLPRMITVATNAAGRGTDIVLSKGSLKYGGLHVIIATYLEEQAEDQGKGRAGRQGEPGSCRIILHTHDEYVQQVFGKFTEEEAVYMMFEKWSQRNISIELLKEERLKESLQKSKYRQERCQIDALQHQVLTEFCHLLKNCREVIKHLDIKTISEKCSLISPVSEEKKSVKMNTMMTTLTTQAKGLLEQQFRKIAVDWKPFLVELKENYIQFILQIWSRFYTDLGEDRDIDVHTSKAEHYRIFYEPQLYKKFHEFVDEHLKKYIQDVQAGFLIFLSEILKNNASDILMKPISEVIFYKTWENAAKEQYVPFFNSHMVIPHTSKANYEYVLAMQTSDPKKSIKRSLSKNRLFIPKEIICKEGEDKKLSEMLGIKIELK